MHIWKGLFYIACLASLFCFVSGIRAPLYWLWRVFLKAVDINLWCLGTHFVRKVALFQCPTIISCEILSRNWLWETSGNLPFVVHDVIISEVSHAKWKWLVAHSMCPISLWNTVLVLVSLLLPTGCQMCSRAQCSKFRAILRVFFFFF